MALPPRSPCLCPKPQPLRLPGVLILGASLGGRLRSATYSIWFELALFCSGGRFDRRLSSLRAYYRSRRRRCGGRSPQKHRHRLVLSGGIAAALIGPAIGKNLLHSLPVEYTVLTSPPWLLCLLVHTCFAFALLPAASRAQQPPSPGGRCRALPCRPCLFCTVGYCLMLMVMLASPPAMAGVAFTPGCRERDPVAPARYVCAVTMTGKMDRALGRTGCGLTGGRVVLRLFMAGQPQPAGPFTPRCFVVGVGWNFMYMGGSTLSPSSPRRRFS